MVNNLTLLIVIPVVIACLNLLLPGILRKLLTFAGLSYLVYLCYLVYKAPSEMTFIYDKQVLALDSLSLYTLIFIQVLSFIIFIFTLKGVAGESERMFFFLYPLTVAFCNGIVLSVNSMVFLVFWGLSGIVLYFFGLMGKTAEAPESAKKTFVLVGGTDVFLILGLILVWYLEPSNGWKLWNSKIALSGELAYVAFFCILIPAFAKAGGFPFHSWVPDFGKDAPVESVAFLPASLDKLVGIYLLARMTLSLFVLTINMHMLLITLGAMTVLFAVMMAMIQHNGRRLLGYHAVSQVGYMIMGAGSGNPLAIIGGLFHQVNNAIYKSNLFLTLGSVEKRAGTNELDDLGGLGRNMPFTFMASLVGALAISGIPPLNGFFSKWMIYQGMLEMAKTTSPGYQIWLLVCLLAAVFGSALTLASFMKFIHSLFLGRRPERLQAVKEAPLNQWLSTGALAVLCITFGLLAVPLPLKKFFWPVLTDLHIAVPDFIGNYLPLGILGLFGTTFVLGLVVFLLIKNVRYDTIYLGGMEALEKFRIAGTEFYNEVRRMKPLRSIYDWAERKYFDVYDIGNNCAAGLSRLFSKIHNGHLQDYNLWIVTGTLILIGLVILL